MKISQSVVCVAAIGACGLACAQQAPGAGSLLATPGLTLNGYLASTYTHFDTNPALRQFDTTRNGFTLNQVALSGSYLPASGAGGAVTLIGGSDAQIMRNGEIYPGTTGSEFDIASAYAQYASGKFTVMAGKFPTLAGAEVVNPADDNEVSRSLLFTTMEPISHTGVRLQYAPDSSLTWTVGMNDGFNFTAAPSGTTRTMELGLSGSPSKALSYSAAYYRGESPLFESVPGGHGVFELLDLVGTVNATEALSFTANADLLRKSDYLGAGSGSASATGLALYANYSVTPRWMLSARAETIDDSEGIVTGNATGTGYGVPNHLRELTLALNYLVLKQLRISAEVRQDRSDTAAFSTGGRPTDRQNSLELGLVYSF